MTYETVDQVIDMIAELQSENARLKERLNTLLEERVLIDNMHRAEVERLTNVEIAHGFALEKLGELRAEVERLNGSLKLGYHETQRMNATLRSENERLTNVEIAHGFALEKLAELRAEVERLNEGWNNEVCDLCNRIAELEGALARYGSCQHGGIDCPCTDIARAALSGSAKPGSE